MMNTVESSVNHKAVLHISIGAVHLVSSVLSEIYLKNLLYSFFVAMPGCLIKSDY